MEPAAHACAGHEAIDVGSNLAGNSESIERGRLALPCTDPCAVLFLLVPWKWTFKAESDATPPVPIPALFVGVAMTVEHISSEVSVFAFRGKGDSTGGRARDLSLIMRRHDPQEELVGGTHVKVSILCFDTSPFVKKNHVLCLQVCAVVPYTGWQDPVRCSSSRTSRRSRNGGSGSLEHDVEVTSFLVTAHASVIDSGSPHPPIHWRVPGPVHAQTCEHRQPAK